MSYYSDTLNQNILYVCNPVLPLHISNIKTLNSPRLWTNEVKCIGKQSGVFYLNRNNGRLD